MRLEVTALATMQLSLYAEAAEEVGDQRLCYCRRLLVWNGLYFRPLCIIVHSDQKVSIFFVASWTRPCYIDGDSLERSPYVVLVHLSPIPSPRAAAGCTGVTFRSVI
jgi:hypothetical protein